MVPETKKKGGAKKEAMSYDDGGMVDDGESRSPAIRIIIGCALLLVVWTLYLVLYPDFIVILQSIFNIIPFLPLTTAQQSATVSFYQILSLMVSAAFVMLFSGILIFFMILPAFKQEGGQYGY